MPRAPTKPTDYAPKKLLEELDRELTAVVHADRLIHEIKALVKQLTHRQMREMCAEILKGGDSVSKVELPDVLDRFAHGD
jgi:hypothetical protein